MTLSNAVVDPTTGLTYHPCNDRGCFYALDEDGDIYVAPMFTDGRPDLEQAGPVDPHSEVPKSEIRAFLATIGN